MENETLDLDVMELADIIGSASDQDDMAQVHGCVVHHHECLDELFVVLVTRWAGWRVLFGPAGPFLCYLRFFA